jgi:phage tail sheath gpL-like
MPVPFQNIPANLLVPFAVFEVNSGGSPFASAARLLLIGQMTSGGAATAGVPYGPIQSEADAIARFGNGSMLVAMYDIARLNAPFQEIWALPLADPSGAAATGTITITAPGATGAGILRVMGRRIVVQINAADNATTVAANIAAAINAAVIQVNNGTGLLPVTAAAASGVVTLTAKHVGGLGNYIEVNVATDEPNVLNGTNAPVVAMAGGNGVPSLTTPLANLGSMPFRWMAGPYADTTSLDAIKAFLNDVSGRWSPLQGLLGHYTGANIGTLSAQATYASARNEPHANGVATQSFRTPPWERAAAWGALEAAHLSTAPECSRPLQTLVLQGVLPPFDPTKNWSITDRGTLYADGLSAEVVNPDGTVSIDRACTFYKTNAAGAPDATFRDTETMGQVMAGLDLLKAGVATDFSRMSIADENPFHVETIATVNDVRNSLIHHYNEGVALGIFDNPELFAASVVVERDQNNADRVNAYLPAQVVGKLRVFAGNLTTFLQAP